jgi:hypothetical protein
MKALNNAAPAAGDGTGGQRRDDLVDDPERGSSRPYRDCSPPRWFDEPRVSFDRHSGWETSEL